VQRNFYPVQVRLASQTPPAVFSACFKGDLINPESLSAALASGEALNGKWISVTTGKKTLPGPSGSSPKPELKAVWDAVYGQEFFVAHTLDAKFCERTILTGSKGTVLEVEIYLRIQEGEGERSSGPPLDIQAVAQRDTSNMYKVVF
jgi:hypothetical protein